jgi:hypothetical protein
MISKVGRQKYITCSTKVLDSDTFGSTKGMFLASFLSYHDILARNYHRTFESCQSILPLQPNYWSFQSPYTT